MLFEEGLYTFLSTNSAIVGVLSTRSYPLLAPQNTSFPVLTYRVTGKTPDLELAQDGMLSIFLELTIWAEEYFSAKFVARIVREQCKVTPPSLGGFPIETVVWRNETDDFDAEAKGGVGLFSVTEHFEVIVVAD